MWPVDLNRSTTLSFIISRSISTPAALPPFFVIICHGVSCITYSGVRLSAKLSLLSGAGLTVLVILPERDESITGGFNSFMLSGVIDFPPLNTFSILTFSRSLMSTISALYPGAMAPASFNLNRCAAPNYATVYAVSGFMPRLIARLTI